MKRSGQSHNNLIPLLSSARQLAIGAVSLPLLLFLLTSHLFLFSATDARYTLTTAEHRFRNCCATLPHVKAFYGMCTYSAVSVPMDGTLKTLRELNVSPLALREWVRCAAEGRNNTECCRQRGISDPSCLVFCDGSDPTRIQLNFPNEYICGSVEDEELVEAIRHCHYDASVAAHVMSNDGVGEGKKKNEEETIRR